MKTTLIMMALSVAAPLTPLSAQEVSTAEVQPCCNQFSALTPLPADTTSYINLQSVDKIITWAAACGFMEDAPRDFLHLTSMLEGFSIGLTPDAERTLIQIATLATRRQSMEQLQDMVSGWLNAANPNAASIIRTEYQTLKNKKKQELAQELESLTIAPLYAVLTSKPERTSELHQWAEEKLNQLRQKKNSDAVYVETNGFRGFRIPGALEDIGKPHQDIYVMYQPIPQGIMLLICGSEQQISAPASTGAALPVHARHMGTDGKVLLASRINPHLSQQTANLHMHSFQELAALSRSVFAKMGQAIPGQAATYQKAIEALDCLDAQNKIISANGALPEEALLWLDQDLHARLISPANGNVFRPGTLNWESLAQKLNAAVYAEKTPSVSTAKPDWNKIVGSLEELIPAINGTLTMENAMMIQMGMQYYKMFKPDAVALIDAMDTMCNSFSGNSGFILQTPTAESATFPNMAACAELSNRQLMTEGWDKLQSSLNLLMGKLGKPPVELGQFFLATDAPEGMVYQPTMPISGDNLHPSVLINDSHWSICNDLNLSKAMVNEAKGATFCGFKAGMSPVGLSKVLKNISLMEPRDKDIRQAAQNMHHLSAWVKFIQVIIETNQDKLHTAIDVQLQR